MAESIDHVSSRPGPSTDPQPAAAVPTLTLEQIFASIPPQGVADTLTIGITELAAEVVLADARVLKKSIPETPLLSVVLFLLSKHHAFLLSPRHALISHQGSGTASRLLVRQRPASFLSASRQPRLRYRPRSINAT